MATEPECRSQGIGAAVLAALLDHVADHGGGVVWCSARAPAVDFYRRAGFLTRGEMFEEPFIGPHVHMLRAVNKRASAKPPV
jgi:ribosomal protein S18 acetylase RimI-like enzyme